MMLRAVRMTVTLLALAVSVVAWPVALWVAIGNPWPAAGIDLGAPMTDDTIVFFLAATLWILWLFWVQFVTCVFVEAVAALRGLRFPTRIPGVFSAQQHLARRLVGAVLATSIGVGGAAASVAGAGAATTPAATASPQAATFAEPVSDNDTTTIDEQGPLPSHTVKRDDTMWDIASTYLGDPLRYREIVQLNQGRTMSDGRTFADGDELRPGWELRLPADADVQLAAAATEVADRHGKEPSATVQVVRGDTMSSLAAKHLGDADRWPELMRLNRDLPQPTGGRLTDPDRLRTGWVLRLPDSSGHGRSEPAHDTSRGDADRDDRIQPMRTKGSASAEIDPSTSPPAGDEVDDRGLARDGNAATGGSNTVQAVDETAAARQDHESDETSPLWMVGGVAGVLAAGFVGFLGRRRMLQARHRRFGERIAMPEPEAAEVERSLRGGEDPLTVEAVDVALRQLAAGCSDAGLALPKVQLVRICGDMIELYLAEAADLPGPFVARSERVLWQIARSSLATESREDLRESVPAPYPSLVTVGVDEDDGHLLVNLEQLGAFGVVGDRAVARHMLAAMTLELAVSELADDLLITVCGLDDRFADLDTGRVVHRRADDALAALESRARVAQGELASAGEVSAAQARVNDAGEREWTPEILVVAGEVDEQWQRRLDSVVEAVPRVAVAAVTATSTRTRWVADVTADGDQVKAVLQPAGVRVTPQVVTDETYEQLVRLVETTGRPAHRPDIVMSGVVAGDVATIDTRHGSTIDVEDRANTEDQELAEAERGIDDASPDVEVAPRVLVLGPLEVSGAGGPILSSRRTKALEIAAYLALHPGRGVEAFWDAVWPDRSPHSDKTSTRRTRVGEVRKWFGTSETGESYLPEFRRGSPYEFHPAVRTDWDTWCELVGADIAEASTEALSEALGLIRGRPFEGVKVGTCGWAQPLITEMLAQLVDVADELGRRHLEEGRWAEAAQVAAVGVMCEPVAERLWRIQIRAAYASGNASNAREVISRMVTFFDNLGLDVDDEETTMLLQLVREHAEAAAVLGRVPESGT